MPNPKDDPKMLGMKMGVNPNHAPEPTIDRQAKIQRIMAERSKTRAAGLPIHKPEPFARAAIAEPKDDIGASSFDSTAFDSSANIHQQVLRRVEIDVTRNRDHLINKIIQVTAPSLPLAPTWNKEYLRAVKIAMAELLEDPMYLLDVLQNQVMKVFPRAGLSRSTLLLYFFALGKAMEHAAYPLTMEPEDDNIELIKEGDDGDASQHPGLKTGKIEEAPKENEEEGKSADLSGKEAPTEDRQELPAEKSTGTARKKSRKPRGSAVFTPLNEEK